MRGPEHAMNSAMHQSENLARTLSDAAHSAKPQASGALDWVGMGELELPIRLACSEPAGLAIPARIGTFVNLCDAQARGIPMSRLYRLVDQVLASGPPSPQPLPPLLRELV